jgi:hypothetical protein
MKQSKSVDDTKLEWHLISQIKLPNGNLSLLDSSSGKSEFGIETEVELGIASLISHQFPD